MSSLLLAISCGLGLGCILGLLGGGGGLIAVPLFAAVFGWSFDQSGNASLACVFAGSAMAVITHARSGRLRIRESVIFGLVGTVAAIGGSLAAFAIPDVVQHAVLTCLLILAGSLMWKRAWQVRRGNTQGGSPSQSLNVLGVTSLSAAVGIGFIVGVLGISGGFLTVPAFTTVVGMSVPQASASALIVVLINSAAALTARVSRFESGDIIALLAGSTAIGAVIGARLARRTSAVMLASMFGSLMFAIALWEASRTLAILSA